MNTWLLARMKRYFIIIWLVLLVGGVAYFWHSIFNQWVQQSLHTVPVLTTGDYMWHDATQMRELITGMEIKTDQLKSELNVANKELAQMRIDLEWLRCEDKWLWLTEYCQSKKLGK